MKPYDNTRPLISIHMPKCGGNSVGLLLGDLFGGRLLTHYPDEKTGELPRQHRAGPGTCIHGHFDNTRGMGAGDYYPEADQFITFLRDPFDLKVSLYFYLKRLWKSKTAWFNGRPMARPAADVNTFLRSRIDAASDYPTFRDFLPGNISLDNYRDVLDRLFVYIGITEDAPMSAGVLARRLGHVPVRMGRQNTSPRDETISPDIREAFVRGHALDYAIYGFALDHYRDRRLPGQYMRSPDFLQRDSLEPRCRLCTHYRICSERGRIPDCDRGRGFVRNRRAEARFPGKWFQEVRGQWQRTRRHTDPTVPVRLTGRLTDRLAEQERLVAALRSSWDPSAGLTVRPWIRWTGDGPRVARLDLGWPDPEQARSHWHRLAPLLTFPDGNQWLDQEMALSRHEGVRAVSVGLDLNPEAGSGFRFILEMVPDTAGEKKQVLSRLGLSAAFNALGLRPESLLRMEICHGARGITRVHLHVRMAGIPLAGQAFSFIGETPLLQSLARRLAGQGRHRLRDPELVYALGREQGRPGNPIRPPHALSLPLVENGIDWDWLHAWFREDDTLRDLTFYHRLRYYCHVVERVLVVPLAGKALGLQYQVWSPEEEPGTKI